MAERQQLPTSRDLDDLLVFLPELYAPNFSAIVQWSGGTRDEGGVTTTPWPEYSETVERFIEAASRECWRDSKYDPVAVGLQVKDESVVATASLQQLKSMATFCVRGERFCDGFWAGMIEQGHVRNILLRLKELRDAGA